MGNKCSCREAGSDCNVSQEYKPVDQQEKVTFNNSNQSCAIPLKESERAVSFSVGSGHKTNWKMSIPCTPGSPGEEGRSKMIMMLNQTRDQIEKLTSDDRDKNLEALNGLYYMVDEAWSIPKYGRDLAYAISNVLREEGALLVILSKCACTDKDMQVAGAQLLEQVMIASNRDYLVECGVESVVQLACSREDPKLIQIGMGIIENLFKHSPNTCTRVIEYGGLHGMLYNCRSTDTITLRHCSAGLCNCAMFGGPINQERMIEQKAPEWLFPLAFNKDNSIRYYALLAICTLAANSDIQRAVVNSGTLDLVEPFVTSHDPIGFAKGDKAHAQGRSEGWLRLLISMLTCERREAQCLAAFHFAMEATIKAEQGRTEIFYVIGVIEPLRKLAASNTEIASTLAQQALTVIGEDIPHKLSYNISSWSLDEVGLWVDRNGFDEYSENFKKNKVDGHLLMTISTDELKEDIGISSRIMCRRFLRELSVLKSNSYSGDRELHEWLKNVGAEYPQYVHNLVQCGLDMRLLPYVTDEILKNDAGITNGVHRLKILLEARRISGGRVLGLEEYPRVFDSPLRKTKSTLGPKDLTDSKPQKTLDVFISYRRATGSQLASLLKVHLQLRGFTVFIDVEKLEAGKFDNNLLNSVRSEVVTAMESKCNIVPVTDNFRWPKPETLPEDMRAICFFNGVKWIHDYQEACIDKVERFLHCQENMGQLGAVASIIRSGNSSIHGGSTRKESSTGSASGES
ncbi:sterile alpha and TIR motif-containing protein 1-like [Anneissia japonica]|uniref:sterile alpha and TIR motif-containing protein 1-like n=1 Tax=Anneissia japonica TaxID=1529436 RepID=UPI00142561A6|nr:sterile alpha and TIR motif-containing protein 1-like [Anneissia japonica]